MKKNKISFKITEEFYNFIKKFGNNRVMAGSMKVNDVYLYSLPDIIVKYFKLNNNRYLELVKMEDENGNK